MLINELFPTFDLPMKANSFLFGAGHSLSSVDDFMNSALLIFIVPRIGAKLGQFVEVPQKSLFTILFTLCFHFFPLLPTCLYKGYMRVLNFYRQKLFTMCMFVGNRGTRILLL